MVPDNAEYIFETPDPDLLRRSVLTSTESTPEPLEYGWLDRDDPVKNVESGQSLRRRS